VVVIDFREIKLADVVRAAQVIAQAFVNDPLCTYMLSLSRTRIRTLEKFFCAYGTINIKNRSEFGVCEPLVGIVFWSEPYKPDASLNGKSRGLFIPILFTLYPIGYFRAKGIIQQTDLLHQRYARELHYYLDNIAVLPGEQGKVISSRLIRPFIDKADANKVSVYTDTVTRKNVCVYEHFGFKCMEECAVKNTGITIWSLLRPVQ
jgi:GNAT superfamily N-acetyltransferase